MALPHGYMTAVERLSLAFAEYRRLCGGSAVLVGGAATAIFTDGAFPSADFDIVAIDDEAFKSAMLSNGFVAGRYPGHGSGGFSHPDCPEYAFEQVSGQLFDGRSEPARVMRIMVNPLGEMTLPSVEDLIADRLAQHAVASPTDNSRLLQARLLFRLHENLDHDYLRRMILNGSGDPALIWL